MSLEIFKESPYQVKENYFKTNMDWDKALELMYKNSDKIHQNHNVLWFKIKNRQILSDFDGVREFCEKVNKDSNSVFIENCAFNDDWQSGNCNCDGLWHIDGPVVSLSPAAMHPHKDLADTCYLQVLGKSFWKLDGKETIVLNPGDLVFVSKTITHEVWGEGPRLGLLMVSKWP
jgi:hypothetical protein